LVPADKIERKIRGRGGEGYLRRDEDDENGRRRKKTTGVAPWRGHT